MNLLNQMRGSWGPNQTPGRPQFLLDETETTPEKGLPEFGVVEMVDAPTELPDEVSVNVQSDATTSVVTLSLNLTTEQALNLFKAALGTQRTILTPREAAGYLRTTEETMEYLAKNNLIPSFLVDGQRRFLKTQVDAWMESQLNNTKENTHAS